LFFSAFEGFDSVQTRIDAEALSLICQKIVTNISKSSLFWKHATTVRLQRVSDSSRKFGKSGSAAAERKSRNAIVSKEKTEWLW
jgi:hypothetical protein